MKAKKFLNVPLPVITGSAHSNFLVSGIQNQILRLSMVLLLKKT